jgi:Tol biopolymer transport system component
MQKTEQQITNWNGWGKDGDVHIQSYSDDVSELYVSRGYLWAIPIDGRNKRQITFDSIASNIVKLRNDKAAYFSSDYPHKLKIETLNTANTSKVLAENLGDLQGLDFSPDGGRIVYCAGIVGKHDPIYPNKLIRSIWVINADGTDQHQISDGDIDFKQLRWSPKGDKIAFLRGNELWFVNPDGTEEKKIPTHSHYIKSFEWNHDGSKITYFTSETIYSECTSLWVMDFIAGTETRILNMAGSGICWVGYDINWSPDGRMIAFIVSGSAGEQVALIKF